MNPADLWWFLPIGYLATVALETPILLIGLSARHSFRRRLFSGFWLTACTYPIVILVLPLLLGPQQSFERRVLYLVAAETFAPVAECGLFWLAFGRREEFGRAAMWRDFAAITVANLVSFGVGEVLHHFSVFSELVGA